MYIHIISLCTFLCCVDKCNFDGTNEGHCGSHYILLHHKAEQWTKDKADY